jgi:predicted nucleic acid-binding protein
MSELFPGYVIDTSALIDLWRPYPRDIFKSLWSKVTVLIADGELIAPQEVLKELEQQHDDLLRWAKKQTFFKELDNEQIVLLHDIVHRFPDIVDVEKTKADADPHVIALAMSKGWKVVTQEKYTKPQARKKIPDVCEHYRIPCLSLFDFFRDKGWNF